MPRLLVTLPDAGGERTFELTEAEITLGRLAENAVQIEDPSVSSLHAHLTRMTSGNYALKDLHSTNGTRVNGRHVTEITLRPGDRLRFGKIDAIYESEISEADAPVQPLPDAAGIAAQPAERSARPVDFKNASPFPKRTGGKDAAGRAILVFAGLGASAFFRSPYVCAAHPAARDFLVTDCGIVCRSCHQSPPCLPPVVPRSFRSKSATSRLAGAGWGDLVRKARRSSCRLRCPAKR